MPAGRGPTEPVDPFAGAFVVDVVAQRERVARHVVRALWILTGVMVPLVLWFTYMCECAGWSSSPLVVLPGVAALVASLRAPVPLVHGDVRSPAAPAAQTPPDDSAGSGHMRALVAGLVVASVLGLPYTLYVEDMCRTVTPECLERHLR